MRRREALVLIIIAGLGGLLGSETNATEPPAYEVYAVRYATLRAFPVSALVEGAEPGRKLDIAMTLWVLKGPDGRIVLVDAGFYRPRLLKQRRGVADFIRPDRALAPLGIKPDEVTDVIVTHMHWDHADGVDLFPRARVWIQKDEYGYYTKEAAQAGANDGATELDHVTALVKLHSQGRVQQVDGDAREILPGVTVYTGGRHTFASQYVGVNTNAGCVVIASDNVYLYENLDKHVPIAQTFDAQSNLAAQDRMKQLAASSRLIIPGHDPDVFVRFPKPGNGVARLDFVSIKPSETQPLVVNLWPGKASRDAGIKGQETSRIQPSRIPGVGPTKLITNVTTPTLTIYQPPRDRNTGTAMVICPGGGYWDLYWELEGEEVAAWLNSLGMTGIILKYRCPRRPGDVRGEPPLGPQLDAQRAVSLVRSRASEWGIDPGRIGMIGFSAGGHLALATATGFSKRLYEPIDAIDQVSCRPDFAVLCYSGYLKARDKDAISPGINIPADTPPILLAHASDDTEKYGGSNAEHSAFMYIALKRAGVSTELHIYATGDHDFGVRQNGRLPSSWPQLCINWLRSQGLLQPHSRP
jgi:glyoxylase-like metal-dependent hydrolase (beta-lactamase superfamily II)/dienelactone hydrolase